MDADQERAPAPPRIKCLGFRPVLKNTLRGFADLLLVDAGLVLKDCPCHRQGNRAWVGFPAKAYEDASGARQWSALIEFAPGTRQFRDAFQEAACAAIREVTQAGRDASGDADAAAGAARTASIGGGSR